MENRKEKAINDALDKMYGKAMTREQFSEALGAPYFEAFWDGYEQCEEEVQDNVCD